MVKNRRGVTKFGCLFGTLLLVAAVYFGLKIGKVYWDASDYQSEIKANAQGAELLTDKQIRDRIVAKADSLGLPDEAKEVTVERVGRHISISADYVVIVELPLHTRSIHFSPQYEYDY